MTGKELLGRLQASVDPSERIALADVHSGLIVGKYNREILLSMLTDNADDLAEIDERKVDALTACLQRYLDRYMEQKEGHKWIILASVYNAFIRELPIHPIEVTHIRVMKEGTRTVYACPCREETEDSVCLYCVCQKYVP